MNADIEKEAVVWQMNYGGRSARCAKAVCNVLYCKINSERKFIMKKEKL